MRALRWLWLALRRPYLGSLYPELDAIIARHGPPSR